jgi:hypothetical protein
MVVCDVEWKTVVRTASLDGGVCCGMKNYCAHCITWCGCVLWNPKLLCSLHHVMAVCVVEMKNCCAHCITWSRDVGVCCGIQNYCVHCITWWWCVLWNEKLLCALHHVMVVCVVEWKTTVCIASRDGGVCCGILNYCAHCITWWCCVLWNPKLLCTLHHVKVVCVVEWKTTVLTASLDGGVCCGMKNCCAHCITLWWCVLWNEKLLCALHHVMVVCVVESKTTVRTASRVVNFTISPNYFAINFYINHIVLT